MCGPYKIYVEQRLSMLLKSYADLVLLIKCNKLERIYNSIFWTILFIFWIIQCNLKINNIQSTPQMTIHRASYSYGETAFSGFRYQTKLHTSPLSKCCLLFTLTVVIQFIVGHVYPVAPRWTNMNQHPIYRVIKYITMWIHQCSQYFSNKPRVFCAKI